MSDEADIQREFANRLDDLLTEFKPRLRETFRSRDPEEEPPSEDAIIVGWVLGLNWYRTTGDERDGGEDTWTSVLSPPGTLWTTKLGLLHGAMIAIGG